MATADKLNRLKQTKAELKAALTEKGQNPGNVFAEYPAKVRAIKTGGGEQATPVIAVSDSGLITATAGDKSATKQLSTQSGKTITPGPAEQIAVAAGKYVTGDVKVAAVESTGGSDGIQFIGHAVGVIPAYDHGYAVGVMSMVGMFESSASGMLAS